MPYLILFFLLLSSLIAKDNFVYDPQDQNVDPRVYNKLIHLQSKVGKLEKRLQYHLQDTHNSSMQKTKLLSSDSFEKMNTRVMQLEKRMNSINLESFNKEMLTTSKMQNSTTYATQKELNRFLLEIDDLHESVVRLENKVKYLKQPHMVQKSSHVKKFIAQNLEKILILFTILIAIMLIIILKLFFNMGLLQATLKRQAYQPTNKNSDDIK
jgi:hypothetical protein